MSGVTSCTPLPGASHFRAALGGGLLGVALFAAAQLGGALLDVAPPARGEELPGSAAIDGAALLRSGCPRAARFWATVKGGVRQRYCALLRGGRAVVWVEPLRAAEHLGEARLLAAGAFAVREEFELSALHALASGDARTAHVRFAGLPTYEGSWDAARVETELSRARAASLAEDVSAASAQYSLVLMHLDELGSSQERARAFIEGALVAALLGRFPEAEAYLGAARAEGAPLLAPVVAASRLYVDYRRGRSLAELREERALLAECASLGWILERRSGVPGRPRELLPVLPERTARELRALAELRTSVADAAAALREAAEVESPP